MNLHGHIKPIIIFFITLIVVLLAILCHISVGALSIPFRTVFDAIFAFDNTQPMHHIIMRQRLPCALVAIICGSTLSLIGIQNQKLFRNPLVSSSTLGVTSGACFAIVAGIFFFNNKDMNIFFPAIIGAFSAGTLTIILSFSLPNTSSSLNKLNIVFAGSLVAIGFSSLTKFIISLDPLMFYEVRDWILGTIVPGSFQGLKISYPFFIVGIILLLFQTRALDTLMLGKEQALTLGVNTRRVYIITIGSSFTLSALCVAIIGPIGFVGLVVPHIAKLFTDEAGYKSALLSMCIGSAVLLLADVIARTLIAPKVLLVGFITAFIGGLVFLILLCTYFRNFGAKN